MTPIADILAAAARHEGGFRTAIPADWMQGRTAFGGLSAALALQAALEHEPDLPPLRSAQIAFIGPLAGAVEVTATKLRRGRNAAFLQSDLVSEAGLGLRATFVFMAELPSTIAHDEAPRAPIAPPAPDAQLYTGPETFFTGNFNFWDPGAAPGPAEWLRWARLRARDGLDPMVELLAIGDALPPGAFKLAGERQTPLSSLNWQINFLTPAPATRDGWWLLAAQADTAHHGYSSQRMTIWNAAGDPVAEAMQGVAIFG
ncbi:acyl-CoA thioesterase [Sphingomonas naasensis]|uniref:Thioesterase family protein n=1 Tax=Sphingomonas naasensis TaxID=1344951 RepID=A0A4S1WN22_9SPHN|nr:thioesterase family protein [Sphingomonas naasensis]NIJ20120.1 acyl-CoA thioesterase [Sphingomonas naasensis]TGX44273.1 thioesterase family protein [Sphingomonas naasensis]